MYYFVYAFALMIFILYLAAFVNLKHWRARERERKSWLTRAHKPSFIFVLIFLFPIVAFFNAYSGGYFIHFERLKLSGYRSGAKLHCEVEFHAYVSFGVSIKHFIAQRPRLCLSANFNEFIIIISRVIVVVRVLFC